MNEDRWGTVKPQLETCLMHLCEVRIRIYLLQLDQHENLFVRVPGLGLPVALQSYLVFDETIDVTDEDEEL